MYRLSKSKQKTVLAVDYNDEIKRLVGIHRKMGKVLQPCTPPRNWRKNLAQLTAWLSEARPPLELEPDGNPREERRLEIQETVEGLLRTYRNIFDDSMWEGANRFDVVRAWLEDDVMGLIKQLVLIVAEHHKPIETLNQLPEGDQKALVNLLEACRLYTWLSREPWVLTQLSESQQAALKPVGTKKPSRQDLTVMENAA